MSLVPEISIVKEDPESLGTTEQLQPSELLPTIARDALNKGVFAWDSGEPVEVPLSKLSDHIKIITKYVPADSGSATEKVTTGVLQLEFTSPALEMNPEIIRVRNQQGLTVAHCAGSDGPGDYTLHGDLRLTTYGGEEVSDEVMQFIDLFDLSLPSKPSVSEHSTSVPLARGAFVVPPSVMFDTKQVRTVLQLPQPDSVDEKDVVHEALLAGEIRTTDPLEQLATLIISQYKLGKSNRTGQYYFTGEEWVWHHPISGRYVDSDIAMKRAVANVLNIEESEDGSVVLPKDSKLVQLIDYRYKRNITDEMISKLFTIDDFQVEAVLPRYDYVIKPVEYIDWQQQLQEKVVGLTGGKLWADEEMLSRGDDIVSIGEGNKAPTRVIAIGDYSIPIVFSASTGMCSDH